MSASGSQLRRSGAGNFFARGVNAALGVWLLFSPRVLDYADAGAASTNHLIVGPIIATFAVIAVAQTSRQARWLNLLLGAWLVLSPLLIGHPPVALANGIAVGMAVVLLALVEGGKPDRLGGGWRAVIDPQAPGAPPLPDEDHQPAQDQQPDDHRPTHPSDPSGPTRRTTQMNDPVQNAQPAEPQPTDPQPTDHAPQERDAAQPVGGQRSGRVVVITGASAGVGRAAARAFAARGDDLCLIARGWAGLGAAQREAKQAGVRAIAIQADVADPQQMLDAADRAESELGPIDVWVNNAMTSVFAPFWEIEPDEYKRVTDVTYHGQVNGTRAALRHMRPRDRGVIVFVGSALAYRSIPLQSAYCGAKHAIMGFTDSLRSELMHEESGIQLTAVHLPAINTPQFRWVRSRLPREAQPVPPIFQPELAADAIVWATDNPRREVHLASPAAAAILGDKIMPGVLDRYMVTAWEGQMIDQPRDASRPDNLYQPVDDVTDHGAHGEFGDRAHESSGYWWFTRNRGWVTAAVAGVGSAVVAAAALRRGGGNGEH